MKKKSVKKLLHNLDNKERKLSKKELKMRKEKIVKFRKILKESPRATVVISKPKMEQAKAIFFNEENITSRGGV